jgi:hypothetical protein
MTSPEGNEARISVVEAGLIQHTADISRLDSKVEAATSRLEHKLDTVIERLAGRPTWPVATFIGILSSTCAALAVALITTANP